MMTSSAECRHDLNNLHCEIIEIWMEEHTRIATQF